MAIINCLVADDEPIAREIIQNYCAHLPTLKVVASCSNALEAREAMLQHKVDILFLDINMPVLDGISFLKTIQHKPQVIFTTAYKEYALNAFDLAAVDYLLKPFSLERFIVAVDKAIERLNKPSMANHFFAEEKAENYLFVKTDNKIYRIAYQDIIYAEANGNYTKIVTTQQTLIPGITFTGFEQQLPSSIFIRVHRSFIINTNWMQKVEPTSIVVAQKELPIGDSYKKQFFVENLRDK